MSRNPRVTPRPERPPKTRRVPPALTLAGANVCAKVAELTHDDCKVGAYPTELIVQKSEQLGLMINS
jgi:hypothetical protein